MKLKQYIKENNKLQYILSDVFICLGLFCFFLPLFIKVTFMDSYLDHLTGQDVKVFRILAGAEGIYIIVSVCMAFISFLNIKINSWMRIVLRAASVLLILVYLLDVLIFKNFFMRITISDVVAYWSNIGYMWRLYSYKIILITGLIILFLTHKPKIRFLVSKAFVAATMILFFCVSIFAERAHYVHGWMFDNYIVYNQTVLSAEKAYSSEEIVNLKQPFKESCEEPIGTQRKNIILLMAESLSSYHSRFLSENYDWTPKLDKLAKENLAFTNFYANGYKTEHAVNALLTGMFSLSQMNGTKGLTDPFSLTRASGEALPVFFNEKGYATDFLTSANLEFTDTGNWAISNGFDFVEGHESKYYEGHLRSHFRAVEDKILLNRALQRISVHEHDPFFMFIKTVTSHHPFKHPHSGERSEEAVIRYVDQQIYDFYLQLQDRDFFNNGILIIVGDHRAMTPLLEAELDVIDSLRGEARVPAIIIGEGYETETVTESFQQADIYNGLKNYVTGVQCTSDVYGDMINGPIPPKYILYKRGDYRNKVSVFSDDGDINVILNGDKTKIEGSETIGDNQKDIIEFINYERTSSLR